jgi:hypothetical protein
MKCWYCGTTKEVMRDPMTKEERYLCKGHIQSLIYSDTRGF